MKQLPAFFFALPSGREPVREWLKGLSADDRKIVGEDIKDVEFAWPRSHDEVEQEAQGPDRIILGQIPERGWNL